MRRSTNPTWLLLVALAAACARSGFAPSPCQGVRCSGHGVCGASRDGAVQCVCATGFENDGPLRCVARRDVAVEGTPDAARADAAGGGDRRQSDLAPEDRALADGGALDTGAEDVEAGPRVEGVPGSAACQDAIDNDGDLALDGDDLDCGAVLRVGHWTWLFPRPVGVELWGVWQAAPGEIWVVGGSGTVLRGDGATWLPLASGTEAMLRDVHGTAAGLAWAVGFDGQILRCAGASCEILSTTPGEDLFALWLTDADFGWAVGDGGAVWQLDQGSWRRQVVGASSWRGVWAPRRDEAWIVGDDGAVQRYNGARWRQVAGLSSTMLTSIHGDDLGTVALVGYNVGPLRWDGAGWAGMDDSCLDWGLDAVWVAADGATWGVGTDGHISHPGAPFACFEIPFTGLSLYALSGLSATELWSVGERGVIGHRGPDGWLLSSTFAYEVDPVHDLWSPGGEEVWISSQSRVARWTAEGFARVRDGQAQCRLWGSGADDVWLAGKDGFVGRWNGAGLTPYQIGTTEDFVALHGSAADDVWLGTASGSLWHWDGSAFTSPTAVGAEPRALYAFGGGELWILLEQALFRYSGATMSIITTITGDRYIDLWGASPDDIWILTYSGAAVHVVDGAEAAATSLSLALPAALSGTAPDAVYALGGYEIARWDGAAWSRLAALPDILYPKAIACGSAGALWVASDTSQVVRYDP